tara:strand:- start:2084 stop:2317 length:234 start_codon:yes stop_codon:yes gene_type:complete
MIQNFIIMNGYGLFIWSSFVISFLACSVLYFKTKKTLQKYEKEFKAEIEKLSKLEQQALLEKSKIADQVVNSDKKTV